ncbi:unnamed protein product [Rhizopus microsporus]
MSFRILSRALRSAPRTTLLSTAIIAPRPVVTVPILQNVRTYAKKSKDNKKSKAEQDVGAEVKEPLFNQDQFEARFDQCVQSLKEHLSNIRVGRANPSLLDAITVRDPQTLMVMVHDTDYTASVDKAIRNAGLGLNPIVESKGIRVPIPKPTKESRDKMAKLVNTTGEQTKAKIRSIRQDGMKLLKEDKKHQSADDIKKMEKLVQTMTDKYNKLIDDLLKVKSKEIQL